MTSLICFPHYTCGGVLSDILNKTTGYESDYGRILNPGHLRGKIGDSKTIYTDYDANDLISLLHETSDYPWISTHCYPVESVLLAAQNVIAVTTTTYKSKLYRWARAYYHYFSSTWVGISGTDLIDKQRETAKNYLCEFPLVTGKNVYNLEFSDFVELTPEWHRFASSYSDWKKHTDRWKRINHFLYEPDFFRSDLAARFNEAEYEVNLQRYYTYQ